MLKAIAILLLVGSTIKTQAATLVVEASAQIAAGDVVAARHEAIDEAIRKAARMVVDSVLSKPVAEQKAALIEEKIDAHVFGFVNKFEIVSETTLVSPADLYQVTAKVEIDLAGLKARLEDVGLAPKEENLPRLMVILYQRNIDDVFWHRHTDSPSESETAVWQVLLQRGFDSCDRPVFFSSFALSQEQAFHDDVQRKNLHEDLRNLVLLAGAQVVVTGSAVAQRANDVVDIGGLSAAKAEVSLVAVAASDGQVIAESRGKATKTHVDLHAAGKMALTEATAQAAQELADPLRQAWISGLAKAMNVTLIVNGLRSIEDLLAFKSELMANVRGIHSLQRRTFSGSTAAFDLLTSTSVEHLVDQIAPSGQKPGTALKSFEVRLRSASANHIELDVKAK